MKPFKLLILAGAAALALGVVACGDNNSPPGGGGSSSKSSTLNGAGSTFAAPIYQQVAGELKSSDGITENYQPIGSGAGVAQFAVGTVDFAGSDPALTSEDVATIKKGKPLQVPFALGAITVSYNVPGLKSGVKLDGKTIADIYLGNITAWNDAEIERQNRQMNLPAETITVVHRSDSSGTTQGFTDFLSRTSSEWKSQVGSDKEVKWPTGTGAQGNDGVAAAVKQTEGSIGYVVQAFALQNGFTFADVKNNSGQYVAPTLESTSAAGNGVAVPADLGINVIDSPNAQAYPITSQTFAITYDDPCKAGVGEAKAKELKTFLSFLVGSQGQDTIQKLSYARLPASLDRKARTAIDGMRCNGNPIRG